MPAFVSVTVHVKEKLQLPEKNKLNSSRVV